VNDAESLLKLIEGDPLNVLLRGMLADELYGVHGMTWAEATRKGLQAARAANDARNLAMGATLLRPSQPWRYALLVQICGVCRAEIELTHSVYTVVGEMPPEVLATPARVLAFVEYHDIAVGAEWVVNLAREIVTHPKQRRAVRRITRGFAPTSAIE